MGVDILTSGASEKKLIAQTGDYIKVKRRKGLKIATAPGEESFYSIPKGSEILVESLKQTEEGKLFYKVKYKSKVGFAYFGDAESLISNKTWSELR